LQAQVETRIASREARDERPGDGGQALVRQSKLWNGSGWSESGMYRRDLLEPGDVVVGPAVLEQTDTTTLILPGYAGRIDRYDNILIEPKQ